MEAPPNIGLPQSRKKRLKRKRHVQKRMKKKNSSDGSTFKARLPGDVQVDAGINNTEESVLMEVRPNNGLSDFSQKQSFKRKKTKSKRKKENIDPNVSARTKEASLQGGPLAELFRSQKKRSKRKRSKHTIKPSANIGTPVDMLTLSLNSDLCTSEQKRKKIKLNPDIVMQLKCGLSRSAKRRKRKRMKKNVDPNESVSMELSALSIISDFCSPGKKRKIETKLDPQSSSPSIEGIVQSLSRLRLTENNIDEDINSNVEFLRQKCRLSSELIWTNPPKKKLLVLDINGILVDILQGSCKGSKSDFRLSGKKAIKRPHCDDFLHFIFDRFYIGVWSSRTKKNVNIAVDKLMGDFKHKLLFKWDQSHCTTTKFKTIEVKHKLLVLKELKKLWGERDHGLPWNKGDFNESNTLLIDDSPYKALRNPVRVSYLAAQLCHMAHTAIFPYPYQHTDKSDSLLGPGSVLRIYLEGIEKANNVQNFVEQNPFGEPAITESHPLWDFYSQVIKSEEEEPSLAH
ncbi:hypothetical protein ACFE04_006957 [Oxalis oulophora]